ncbi:MAG: aminotransferase class III-fold pyridoxal phosphate-dependent enzyme, partial [Candidatus Spechtbacterales bacterium]
MSKVSEVREKLYKHVAPNYAPLEFVERVGSGEWVYGIVEGEDGNDSWKSVLDLHTNYSALGLGHRNPEIEALLEERRKEKRIVLYSRGAGMSEELADLGEKLSRLSGTDMILPKNAGTEGFDLAVKTSRLWGYKVKGIPEGRAEIIVCERNFHGRSDVATAASSDEETRKRFGPHVEWAFRRILFGDLAALEKALSVHDSKYIAAFIVEPIQAEAGVIVPPEGYIREARRLCRKYNALFILDEVQTGLGRTGKMFCWQHDGEEAMPDGMILGKALGGGFSKESVFVSSKEVLGLLTEGTEGSTFGGDPEGCAIAGKVLDIVSKPSFLKRVETLGEEFIE